MKSYLGLVSEYAKVHKKKNRLTVICIAISVMLVTAMRLKFPIGSAWLRTLFMRGKSWLYKAAVKKG